MTNWAEYFSLYGSGMTMYRTNRLKKLVLDGLPEKLRGRLWMTLSGAENEVRGAVFIFRNVYRGIVFRSSMTNNRDVRAVVQINYIT